MDLSTAMRTECAVSQTGKVGALAQFSDLRKETITASDAA